MSAKGYCYDNAFAESFFKTLKAEVVYLTEYETFEDVLATFWTLGFDNFSLDSDPPTHKINFYPMHYLS